MLFRIQIAELHAVCEDHAVVIGSHDVHTPFISCAGCVIVDEVVILHRAREIQRDRRARKKKRPDEMEGVSG